MLGREKLTYYLVTCFQRWWVLRTKSRKDDASSRLVAAANIIPMPTSNRVVGAGLGLVADTTEYPCSAVCPNLVAPSWGMV